MRERPTLRIPLGIILLVILLAAYSIAIMWASQWIGQLHALVQGAIYLVLGTVWILPARRLVIWMETGR
jgi:hypothetical protein